MQDKTDSSIQYFSDWLDSYLNFERTPKKGIFWLDTMRFFTEKLGHPEKSYRCFHVAGSKGKGSTAQMIAEILEAAGYKTGLYTSPHIMDFRERIVTTEGFLSDDVYRTAADELIAAVAETKADELPGGRSPTWFELVTLFAMLCFKYAQVDWVVWEVGLGGRLDSTNVVSPDCCCIGPIELEHTEFLGDTLEKIAAEKAGIIKDGVPVIVAPQQTDSVKDVFRKTAAEHNAPLTFVDEAVTISGIHYTSKGPCVGMKIRLASKLFASPLCPTLRLLGTFQAENAAVAALAVKTLLSNINERTIETGLAKAYLPGRFEIVPSVKGYSDIPVMILDGAHTPRSMAFTIRTFNGLYDGKHDAVLLFACAADKDAEDMATMLKGSFSSVIITRPGETKAADMDRLGKAFAYADIPYTSIYDYNEAIAFALQTANKQKKALLVTGSFYLVAEVKKALAAL